MGKKRARKPMGKPDRLGRALIFCKPGEERAKLAEHSYFAGTIKQDEYGFLKIEGYLYESRKEAQGEIIGRLKRAQAHYSLILGEFKGEIEFSNKNRWRGIPIEIKAISIKKKK